MQQNYSTLKAHKKKHNKTVFNLYHISMNIAVTARPPHCNILVYLTFEVRDLKSTKSSKVLLRASFEIELNIDCNILVGN